MSKRSDLSTCPVTKSDVSLLNECDAGLLASVVFAEVKCICVCCYCRIIWSAGVLAAMGNITYPSISSFVSAHASDDQQGCLLHVLLLTYLLTCLFSPPAVLHHIVHTVLFYAYLSLTLSGNWHLAMCGVY